MKSIYSLVLFFSRPDNNLFISLGNAGGNAYIKSGYTKKRRTTYIIFSALDILDIHITYVALYHRGNVNVVQEV